VRKVSIGSYPFDIHPTNTALEAAFDRLYARVIVAGGRPQLDREFRDAAHDYFDSKAITDYGAHDHYFYGFAPLWAIFRGNWRFDLAEGIWRLSLEPVHEWEQAHPGLEIDKGLVYYFWATTALMMGNIDSGYMLAHRSFEEDSRTTRGNKYPDTPAFALVSLNFVKQDQGFRLWVEEQAAFLRGFIEDYSKTHGRSLSLDEFRDRFLLKPPNHDTVFLLAYTIARLKELSEIPHEAKQSSFASQLQLNLLFDLVLVIDNAIKHHKPSARYFPALAAHLLDKANHKLNEVGELNPQFDTNFGPTMTSALDATLTLKGKRLGKLQCDLAAAYGIRNRGAHHLESEPVVCKDFDRILHAIFRALCAAVDHLY